jgi:hypothetical protein
MELIYQNIPVRQRPKVRLCNSAALTGVPGFALKLAACLEISARNAILTLIG